MTIIEKIDIPQISLSQQKITDFIELSIELRDNSVVYTAKFYADEPIDDKDEGLGWQNNFNSFKCIASKTAISGIEKDFLKDTKKWAVYIMVSGFNNDIKVYFKRESEAESLFDKLHKWLYE